MKVSYEGVAEQVATFQVDTTDTTMLTPGAAVALSGNGTVKACPASATPAGVVRSVENGMAAVQVAGYMRFPCAEAMTVGYAQLALDSSKKLAAGSTGRGGLGTDVDGDTDTCGVIFC